MADTHSIQSIFLNSSLQPVHYSHQISTTLTQDNYLLWKLHVVLVLRGHGLMAFVDGSKAPPPEFITRSNGVPNPNPAFENWMKQDQLILAWIFNSLSPQILAQVVNCHTSSQLWHRLNQIYSSQSVAKILEYKLKLQTIRKGGDTCAEYLQKIQSIADRLSSIGSPVPDQDLMLYTLQGLGSEFENFVTAISLRPTPITGSELYSLLLAHEARLHTNSLNSIAPQVVNLTATGNTSQTSNQVLATQYSNRMSGNQGQNVPRGQGCGRHSGGSREDITCQICSKWGHSALKCYHKFDISFTGPTTSSQPQQSHQALVAEPSITSFPSPTWFLDSGATTHVTPDLNNLSSSQVYQGSSKIHLGNDSALHITHTGSTSVNCYGAQLHLDNVLCVPHLTKNLLSVSQLLKDNSVIIEFNPDSWLSQ